MWAILTIILFLSDLVKPHSISWSEKSNNVDSSCATGLINEKDNIVLYSRIYMGPQNDLMDRAQFEIKKLESVYETLCYVDLTNCHGYTLSNCYCTVKSEAYVIDVVINMTALTAISQATVRGTLYNFNNQIVSEEYKLPPVHDISKPEFHVNVNGKTVIKNYCESQVSGKNVAILFQRPSHVNLPYSLAVQYISTNRTVKTASDILTYTAQMSGHTSLELSYGISTISQSRRSLFCNINTEDACVKFQHKLNAFIGLFTCVIILCLGIIISILLIRRKYKIVNHLLKDDKMETSEEELQQLTIAEADDGEKKVESSTMEVYKHSKVYESNSMLPTDVIELKAIKKFEFFFQKKKNSEYDSLVQHQLSTMVRLTVSSTSHRRPSTWPGTKTPYPYYKSIECDTGRVGIGRIIAAQRFSECNKDESRIWRTEYPRFQKKEWIEVLVYTSRHVIFDDTEAKLTKCTLLGNINKQTGMSFDGVNVVMANLAENWTLFTCYSCDVNQFDNLKSNLQTFNIEWIKFMKGFLNYEQTRRYYGFQVTLSSGLRKEVNVKDLLDMYIKDRKQNKFSFTINTYFPYKKLAIYIERVGASFIYRYQKNIMLQFVSKLLKEPMMVGAFPIIMSDSAQ